ncbi:heme ABC transporter ATP-binding protein [Pseudoalteromonas sp. NZS100]|uniref:heme ABC transporter ATP-binding protein n=1 Tax=Pseudoalteromonas sp. NZS100 TaxID=2792046 RepID=UPI0018CCD594|nr:heme ABC transporter ATP-binding protein [Pseudoalteromonas sp. NZS100]MBH0068266.1 heme ABC transporter ATP-binding protein [Pseudoalteromonas sp. NZS100]
MIAFNNLSVGFGNHNVLNTINGSAKQGQLVALLGENGAGKSTLLHTLAGMHAFKGSVLFNNKPLTAHAKKSLATQRAVMMQANHVGFDFTVFELIAMGRYPYVESLKMQSEKVHKYAAIMDLSNYLTRRVSALSGGEQQRAHMARTLAQLNAFTQSAEPKLMLLDEPTSALDMRHQHALLSCVKAFVEQGNSAIIAIHDLNLASLYATDAILLHNKKVLQSGPINTVLTEQNLQQMYAMKLHVNPHPYNDAPMVFSQRQEFL